MSVNAPNNQINWEAPEFELISVDGKYYNLKQLMGNKGIVIAFICNHCPYVVKIINRLVYEASELKKIGVSMATIMSNNTESYPDDSYDNMKLFSKKHDFTFPYLYDSTQKVAKLYQAVCTPDIYGFNQNKVLKYRCRIDSGVMTNEKNIKRELYNAMKLITETNEGPEKQFNSFGCSIKWK